MVAGHVTQHPAPDPIDDPLPQPDIRHEDVLVVIADVHSVATVMEITRVLQDVGIPAVPDVHVAGAADSPSLPSAFGPEPIRHGQEHMRVLVPEQYQDVARQMLDATTHAPQGKATMAEITDGFGEPNLPIKPDIGVGKVIAWVAVIFLGASFFWALVVMLRTLFGQ